MVFMIITLSYLSLLTLQIYVHTQTTAAIHYAELYGIETIKQRVEKDLWGDFEIYYDGFDIRFQTINDHDFQMQIYNNASLIVCSYIGFHERELNIVRYDYTCEN